MKTLGALALASLLALAPRAAFAKDGTAKRARAISVGSPSEGKLVGGQKLTSGPSVRVVGEHPWGLPDLVSMLTRSAEHVAKKFPGSVLTVGDLSKKGGGDVDGHRSHESGRDADVGFYLTRGKKAFVAPRFATIAEDGRAKGLSGVRFDDARNWALVETWLTDPRANVLMIFAAKHIETRLLEQAARAGAPPSLRARAAEVLIQPKGALPHDNHFHVRITCPRGQKDCQNFGPRTHVAHRAPTPGRHKKAEVASRRARPTSRAKR